MIHPMMITSFRKVAPVLPVRDVVASMAHYRSLGFTARPYDQNGPDGAPFYGYVASGDVQLHLARVDDLDPATNMSACYLYVDDAAALYQSWSTSGADGRFVPPTDTDYGLREFAHVDRDGNLLRVGSPLPGP